MSYHPLDFRELYYCVCLEVFYQRYVSLCARMGAPPRSRRHFATNRVEGSGISPSSGMIRNMVLRNWSDL